MKNAIIKNCFVFGLLFLLISVSISSVIPVEGNTYCKRLNIMSDKENQNSINTDDETYENTNCLIIGATSEAYNNVEDDGNICFGWALGNYPHASYYHTSGWVYSNGDNGRWIYSGGFFGQLGSISYVHWYTEDDITHYIGVKGLRGYARGATRVGTFTEPGGGYCSFIGFAEEVKFRTAVDIKSIIFNNKNEERREFNEIIDADLIELERLLDRFEVYSNLLLVLFNYKPKVLDDYEEISNMILILNKNDWNGQICNWLLDVLDDVINKALYYFDAAEVYETNGRLVLMGIYLMICRNYLRLGLRVGDTYIKYCY
jgi:hypothetical protein